MTNHLIPNVYLPPMGLPLYWMNEESGVLRSAVLAYYDGATGGKNGPSQEQITLLRDYLKYVINAPCWSMNTAASVALQDALKLLREDVENLQSCDDISTWVNRCLDIGIDVL